MAAWQGISDVQCVFHTHTKTSSNFRFCLFLFLRRNEGLRKVSFFLFFFIRRERRKKTKKIIKKKRTFELVSVLSKCEDIQYTTVLNTRRKIHTHTYIYLFICKKLEQKITKYLYLFYYVTLNNVLRR